MPSKNIGEELGSTPGKRIIESFRKITPTKQLEDPMSQNSSIQTIYRNRKTCQLGKNIPRHKLMKSLLENLDSDEMHESKTFPNKGRRKYKNSKKQLFEKDEVVRADFSVSFDLKQQNKDATVAVNHLINPLKSSKSTPQIMLVATRKLWGLYSKNGQKNQHYRPSVASQIDRPMFNSKLANEEKKFTILQMQ